MGRHAEARHVDPDHPDPVDLGRQAVQRNARRGRNTQIDHHDRVVLVRLGHLGDGIADVFVELTGDEGFRIERNVADRPASAVEMRREGQTVHTAGRPREDRRRPPHPQPDPQRAERRTHGLWLVVRPFWIIGRESIKNLRLAGFAGSLVHHVGACMAARRIRLRLLSRRVEYGRSLWFEFDGHSYAPS